MAEGKIDPDSFDKHSILQREKLSVCIITKNEGENLPACLESITGIADEVIVLDSGSTDGTREIARSFGAKVFEHPFDDFSSQKSRAVSFSSFLWVLIIDSDERVSSKLANSISQFLSTAEKTSSVSGLYINRLNFFLGKPIRHSGWSPDWLLRIFRKDHGHFDGSSVHESITVQGKTERLGGYLFHYTHPTIEVFVQKNLQYAILWAKSHQGSHRASVLNLVGHPLGTFLKMYVVRRGFLDGFSGFVLAILYSYHVFLKYLMLFNPDDFSGGRSGADQ